MKYNSKRKYGFHCQWKNFCIFHRRFCSRAFLKAKCRTGYIQNVSDFFVQKQRSFGVIYAVASNIFA